MRSLSDHLTTKDKIDPKTGERQRIYYYKGKHCPTHLIKGPLAKQYIGYQLIMRDLEDAERWLTHAYDFFPKEESDHMKPDEDRYRDNQIGDEKNHAIVKSLFFSSLIFYGKCFTQAKGRGVKLEKSIVPPGFHAKHDCIMEYRHTLAAHSGEGQWDTGKLRLLLPPKKGSNIGPRINSELHRLDFEDDRMDKCQFLELIKIVHRNVKTKKDIIGQKIFKEIILPRGEDYWYKSSPKSQ